MRDGRVVQVGAPEDLYFTPGRPLVRGLRGRRERRPGPRRRRRVTRARQLPATAAASSDVDVLVRPELVGLEPDGAAPAEVVERTFLGHDVLYRVRLADGTTLWSQRPSNEQVPLGAHVRVRVHDGPIFVLPS